MYKVIFNDSGTDQLGYCKSWWQSFIIHILKNVDRNGWVKQDYMDHIDSILSEYDIMIDRTDHCLLFKSQTQFTWFVLRFSV